LDNTSNYFDAHDGSTRRFEPSGPFYYHAMGYGTCLEDGKQAEGKCGQWSNNTVGVWRSTTLASGSWEKLSSFTPSSSGWPKCTYFRSHVLRSPTTGKYVLWLNAQAGKDNQCTDSGGSPVCPKGSSSKCFLAGSSDTPAGPFKYEGVVNDIRYASEGGVGDFGLFQDDDAANTSYVIYKRSGAAPKGEGHRMTLQRLLPSLLAAEPGDAASAGIIGAPFVEAPAMFKRKGRYYSLFGACCAFCAHGTGIGVYHARSPLGPWVADGNIGCSTAGGGSGGGSSAGSGSGSVALSVGGSGSVSASAPLPAGCGCGLTMPSVYNLTCPPPPVAVTRAQQNSVIMAGGDEVVWTGDRWQSACAATVKSQGLPATGIPKEQDCVKAWDLQYWATLRWDETADPPLPLQVQWENEIVINIS
jgi:hypothetical protein